MINLVGHDRSRVQRRRSKKERRGATAVSDETARLTGTNRGTCTPTKIENQFSRLVAVPRKNDHGWQNELARREESRSENETRGWEEMAAPHKKSYSRTDRRHPAGVPRNQGVLSKLKRLGQGERERRATKGEEIGDFGKFRNLSRHTTGTWMSTKLEENRET